MADNPYAVVDNPDYINLHVSSNRGLKTFRMNIWSSIGELKQEYSKHINETTEKINFMYKIHTLRDEDTPELFDMKNNDRITAWFAHKTQMETEAENNSGRGMEDLRRDPSGIRTDESLSDVPSTSSNDN
uniref:Ubiquitin-like domain-containing protein n=1 Tax=Caenorhabditis tropicalis TaxID=1561998 RepID=A0A1I7TLT8_9PELO